MCFWPHAYTWVNVCPDGPLRAQCRWPDWVSTHRHIGDSGHLKDIRGHVHTQTTTHTSWSLSPPTLFCAVMQMFRGFMQLVFILYTYRSRRNMQIDKLNASLLSPPASHFSPLFRDHLPEKYSLHVACANVSWWPTVRSLYRLFWARKPAWVEDQNGWLHHKIQDFPIVDQTWEIFCLD